MIQVGRFNKLKILRKTSVGLYLGNEEETEDVLLPNKYCPADYSLNSFLNVFIYRDNLERKIATNIHPKIELYECACLKVKSVTKVGAFLDWGLEKELLVPFPEQKQKMTEGRYYIVFLTIDEKTDRLFASTRLKKYLNNDSLMVEEGEEVELIVLKETELGFSVIINNLHFGLIYKNEVFTPLKTGDKLKGYVKNIREDNKIDISLQPIGYENYKDDNMEIIIQTLQNNEGFLSLNDKSSPHDIYKTLNISKKSFKKAVGNLYRLKKISLDNDGIRLL